MFVIGFCPDCGSWIDEGEPYCSCGSTKGTSSYYCDDDDDHYETSYTPRSWNYDPVAAERRRREYEEKMERKRLEEELREKQAAAEKARQERIRREEYERWKKEREEQARREREENEKIRCILCAKSKKSRLRFLPTRSCFSEALSISQEPSKKSTGHLQKH